MREIVRSDLGEGVLGNEVQGADITRLKRLCWRGDSRTPREIFEFGLRRRDDTAKSYFRRQKLQRILQNPGNVFEQKFQGRHLTPEIVQSRRMGNDILAPTAALFRTDQNDIAPATAVCVAKSFVAGCLFPLVAEDGDKYDKTWVYAVYLENGFNTFQMQVSLNAASAAMAFVQEACCNDIPPMHVLGAIQVERKWHSVINWAAGAVGYIENGTAAQLFQINPKSVGCVGRDNLIQNAIREIAQAGARFDINWK